MAIGVILVAPSNYYSRMKTISDYQEDSSAMGRIKAWRTAMEMAADYPMLGVGAGSFNSAYGRFYRKHTDPSRWISTHSVYFKVVAEYGYPGLIVFIMIIISSVMMNNKTYKILSAKGDPPEGLLVWPKILNWSIITWTVSAMFLSGVDYPHLYILVGLTLAIRRLADNILDMEDNKPQLKPWDEEYDEFKNNVFK
jgi:O-antigen ligase